VVPKLLIIHAAITVLAATVKVQELILTAKQEQRLRTILKVILLALGRWLMTTGWFDSITSELTRGW